MGINEWIKKHGLQMEVDSLKNWQSVDVDFINSDGKEDETQFDVSFIGTKTGIEELTELFNGFCKEHGYPNDMVRNVAVVKSADTHEELLKGDHTGVKFKEGGKFAFTCPYTGGRHSYVITSRTKDKIICAAVYHEADGMHQLEEEFALETDDKGNESVILWTCADKRGVLSAYEIEF